ncbi:bis(5'-nucleosyl)-tetraphosphatase (symmetrical) YqeK [Sebaldella sp. S0638]|uniref:bis(5'-nucleosyl)-tetraphosphatase (symmetrical) YqeK n=1 Tax=Sebaldella sp. S0638 TaxID=2957809 RepID=UPI0020A13B74|nr:bis(5'-nucleosyl)-tetraphosphatase (symmetrical) YqeK [Sebaldella sp. S0638]MCP1225073.1 bis(5'-nucleosyl)-tetraphosphatase (symmetrical) YqeK [Sebaldella sp. S0638]
MEMKKISEYVKTKLDEKRYNHTKRVVKKAKQLAKLYNAPIDKVKIGAYLHDIAKFYKLSDMVELVGDKYPEVNSDVYRNGQILHGFAAAEVAEKELGIDDEEILDAIRYHTIGKKDMSLTAKIVYLADAIEDDRDWLGVVKTRKLAEKNIDTAIIYELNQKIEYLIKKDSLIHPNTLTFRNDLLTKKKKEREKI